MTRVDGQQAPKRILPQRVLLYNVIEPKYLNTLTDYAARTRYPGQGPNVDDAKEAIELAKLVRSFAKKFLGL
jgi:hypothetical protein